MDAAATHLNDARDSLRPEEQRLVGHVAEYGWRSTGVAAPAGYAAYSYTTGLWLTHDAPELILFDLTEQLRHDLFGTIAAWLGEGRRIAPGELGQLMDRGSICLIPVGRARADAYLPGTRWFYRNAAFPCLQLVWSDGLGRYPWDADFDAGLVGVQPDLSEGGDWGGMAVPA